MNGKSVRAPKHDLHHLRRIRTMISKKRDASKHKDRILGKVATPPKHHNTSPSGEWDSPKKKMYEDGVGGGGGAVASGMSVGGGSVSPISGPQADPTASATMSAQHANAQHDDKKKKKKKFEMFRRKKPTL